MRSDYGLHHAWGRHRHAAVQMTRQELEDKAVEMWREGLSATQIGVKLHKTRNAIIGIVHRAKARGVEIDPHNIHPRRGGHTHGVARKKRGPSTRKLNVTSTELAIMSLKGPPDPPEPKSFILKTDATTKKKYKAHVPLHETASHSCRYSTGVNKKNEYLFCNAPPKGPHYWCEEHYKKIYQPVRR